MRAHLADVAGEAFAGVDLDVFPEVGGHRRAVLAVGTLQTDVLTLLDVPDERFVVDSFQRLAADVADPVHLEVNLKTSNIRSVGIKLEMSQMVSILKYRGTTQYRYRICNVSKYRLTTGWFIFNVFPR